METTLTSKGQAAIPGQVPAGTPGTQMNFLQIELSKEGEPMTERERRFRSAIGSATIKWDVDDLWVLLRGED